MCKTNTDIRKTAKEKGVCLWEIARVLDISEATMTRKMRNDLTENEKKELLVIIEKLSTLKANASC